MRFAALVLLFPTLTFAAPMQFTHQGRLLDAAGGPLDGPQTVDLALFPAPSGGVATFEESLEVSVSDGYYSVTLGTDEAANPLDTSVFAGSTVYLQLSVDGSALGSRQAVVGVPLAAHAKSVHGTVQIGAVAGDCDSPSMDGTLRFTGSSLDVCIAGEWLPTVNLALGSQPNPAQSCADIAALVPAVDDGVYWLKPDAGSSFQAWCDAEEGWTLALMIKLGDDATFDYYSEHWASDTPLNPDIVNPSIDENMSSPAYTRMPVTQVRFDLTNVGNSLFQTVSSPSLRDALTGSYQASSLGRTTFLNWLDVSNSNWDNQPNCNVAGIQATGPDPANCRFGLLMNNENSCSSADAAVGIGCHTNNHHGVASDIRYTAAGGHRWSTSVRYQRRAWIWVR